MKTLITFTTTLLFSILFNAQSRDIYKLKTKADKSIDKTNIHGYKAEVKLVKVTNENDNSNPVDFQLYEVAQILISDNYMIYPIRSNTYDISRICPFVKYGYNIPKKNYYTICGDFQLPPLKFRGSKTITNSGFTAELQIFDLQKRPSLNIYTAYATITYPDNTVNKLKIKPDDSFDMSNMKVNQTKIYTRILQFDGGDRIRLEYSVTLK
jgi:hypothetical protein